jgi:hypothetical protein
MPDDTLANLSSDICNINPGIDALGNPIAIPTTIDTVAVDQAVAPPPDLAAVYQQIIGASIQPWI